MAEQVLILPDDSANTGKQLRTQELTVGAEVVQQEVVTVAKADGTLLAPLTDTELRATPVPVSGTVTASGPLTDAQLRATAVPGVDKPATTGGCLIYRAISAASTNAASIKASAGQVYGWYFFNNSATIRYVKLYNKASAPTVGTDTPVMTLGVPPGGGAVAPASGVGIAFATGIAIAIVNGIADSDATAIGASEVAVNLWYF